MGRAEKAGTHCPKNPELCFNRENFTANAKHEGAKISRATSAALRQVSTIRGDKTSWPRTCRWECGFHVSELPGVCGSGILHAGLSKI